MRVAFGEYHLDTEARTLRCHDQRVSVQAKAFDLLAYLIEHRDRVVSTDELLDALWPSLQVTPAALSTAVQKARRAVGDDGGHQAVLHTEHGKGFRFVAKISVLSTPEGVTQARNGVRARFVPADVPPIRSLAILPLENFAGNSEQEYFADGMTEALISDLARISSLRVISRTSVMQYKRARKPLPEIARELDVDGVIEGTVSREGDRVQINVQLVDARNDRHLWAERFERDLRGVFALQGEVARTVADRVQLELTHQEEMHLEDTQRVDPKAVDAFLRGGFHSALCTPSDIEKAIGYFEQAVQRDPSFARGYAELALAYEDARLVDLLPRKDAAERMRRAALEALTLDDSLAKAHTAWGIALHNDWQWEQAGKELKRGAELTPGDPRTLRGYSYFLSLSGRHDESIALMKRAVTIAPHDLRVRLSYASRLFGGRRYESAIEEARTIFELDPHARLAHNVVFRSNLMLGREKEAGRALNKYWDLGCESWEIEAAQRGYRAAGWKGAIRARLEAVIERGRETHEGPSAIAAQYITLGDADPALHWLERAYEERASGLAQLCVSPLIDFLRSDPRFADLLRRINYPVATGAIPD
jgi:TolB-like protein